MNDTICAIATPPGGAIGIVRISGDKTLEILSHIFSKDLTGAKPNTVHYGYITDPQTTYIDQVLVTIFHAPHSYTGEHSAEISCHGSPYILNKVLDLLCQEGCRIAQPGEFTKRAYLNGKLDLSQAEAVADLIATTNKATHHIAISQLRGAVTTELAQMRQQLLKLTSLVELELDFSDHEDLQFADRKQLIKLALDIDTHITTLAHSFQTGQAIKNGINVAIVGKTNVGKSTLLNALLKDDRAIVSDIHGTTRDTIDINGITFRFIDTAGIRQTQDKVEQIGIQRTYDTIQKARIVIWLIDTIPTPEEVADITTHLAPFTSHPSPRTLIPVWNKADICPISCHTLADQPVIAISAKTRQGIPELETAIYNAAHIDTITDTHTIITNARHYDALNRAHHSITRLIQNITELTTDILSEDLRQTINILAEITGDQITPQETLNNIFAHFCVGK